MVQITDAGGVIQDARPTMESRGWFRSLPFAGRCCYEIRTKSLKSDLLGVGTEAKAATAIISGEPIEEQKLTMQTSWIRSAARFRYL